MKRVIMLLLVFVLVGCNQQSDESCDEDICINSLEYNIEGTISVTSIERDQVNLESIIIDEMRELRNVTLTFYTSDMDFIGSDSVQVENKVDMTLQFSFRSLEPSTDYIAVLHAYITVDGENRSIVIANTEFSTVNFIAIDVTGAISNVRVGESFVVFDIDLLSNDYYIVSYGIFLYKGEEKVDELTVWGNRALVSVSTDNLVFSDLIENTVYSLKFDVIYENGSNQDNSNLDEVSFTTN